MKYRIAWALCTTLLVGACGETPSERASSASPGTLFAPSSAPAAPVASAGDFERSPFVRRHPIRDRRVAAGVSYFVIDAEAPDAMVQIEFAPAQGAARRVQVTWRGGDTTPAWSSVKKQFYADLLESSFWDIDYGELSAFVLEHGRETAPTPAALQRRPLGPAKAYAGITEGGLVVGIERQ